jgi:hypothetical protein
MPQKQGARDLINSSNAVIVRPHPLCGAGIGREIARRSWVCWKPPNSLARWFGNAAWAESLAWKLPKTIRTSNDWPIVDNVRPTTTIRFAFRAREEGQFRVFNQFVMDGVGTWKYLVSSGIAFTEQLVVNLRHAIFFVPDMTSFIAISSGFSVHSESLSRG